jgi:hypothetical protein
MPSLAQATGFKASEISSMNLTSSGGTGAGGLIELESNGGLIITDVADSVYNEMTSGGTIQQYTGYPAVLHAVLDGESTSSTQGIAPMDSRNSADPHHGSYAVSLVNNNVLGASTWGGVSVNNTGNIYLLRETWSGDANLDGLVTVGDYQNWALEFGSQNASKKTWNNGDLNLDGLVTVGDYQLWALAFSKSLPSLGGSAGPIELSSDLSGGPSSGGPSSVPEPGTLSLLLMGSLGCLAVKWFRRRSPRI